jgi:hypothetical protein
MRKPFKLRMNLQLFAEGEVVESGVESVPAAGEPTEPPEPSQTEPSGVEPTEAAAQIKDEKDFASALKAREAKLREQLESEFTEKYKDYDAYKDVAEYVREQQGFEDILSAKEAVELARLQTRAKKAELPVEVQQRLESLEAKAAKVEEYEQQQAQQKTYQEFRSKTLEPFAKDKGVDADTLEKFMVEQQVYNPDIAYRAMNYENVQSQREQIEKEAIKKFLEAKGSMPRVESKASGGSVIPGTPKTFQEARQRALQRLGG